MKENHLRKLVAGFCMVTSPIVALASWIAWPTLTSDGETFVDNVMSTGWARVMTSMTLNTVSIALAVVAVMGLVHLLHGHYGTLGLAGGGAGIAGLVLLAVFSGGGIAGAEVALSDIARADKIALYETVSGSLGWVVGYVGSGAMAIGFLLLGIALFRAHVVPEPSAMLLGAFGIVQVAGYALWSMPVVVASFVMLAVAAIPVGFQVLAEGDESWVHPPTFHWYHSTAG